MKKGGGKSSRRIGKKFAVMVNQSTKTSNQYQTLNKFIIVVMVGIIQIRRMIGLKHFINAKVSSQFLMTLILITLIGINLFNF